MKNTAIIIPTRLGAKRFPNKPLEKINNVPMIVHVLNRAKESQVGEVFIATPDHEIINIVKESGGQAILTKRNHPSGSDRVYEAYIKNNLTDFTFIPKKSASREHTSKPYFSNKTLKLLVID